MFVYKVEFTKKEEQIDPVVTQAHLQRLQQAKDAEIVVFGGAFTDGTGGMTIFHADSMEAARAWVEQDAYVHNDTHSWSLREIKRGF